MQKDAKNLKIALVSVQNDAERVPPVGLVYIATYLNERVGVDFRNIKIMDANFDEIEKKIDGFKPDLIGFSSMTVNYGDTIKLAKKLRVKYKEIPFIIGGVHVSTLPLSLDPVFDSGVIGEGEETIKEIIETLIKKGKLTPSLLGKIKSTIFFEGGKIKSSTLRKPIADLDSLPIPNYKFANPKYFEKSEIPSISAVGIKAYILSSRGCPYRCIFCSTSRFWGRMRFHSADYTARVAKRFIDDFNSNYIKMMDDMLTVSVQRVKEIRAAFEKYGVLKKIKGMDCSPRANLITEELIIEMKKVKITTVNFGFESGSERILKFLKGDNSSVSMNKRAIVLCTRHGLRVYGSLIYGSPGETIEDMKKTNEFIDFAIKNGARYIWSFVATPFPATPFWDIALERGKVNNNMDWNLLSHHTENPLLLDESIDRNEFFRVFKEGKNKLNKLKIKMMAEFVIRNPLYMTNKISSEPSYYFSRAVKQLLRQ